METNPGPIELFAERVLHYGESRLELLRLKTIDRTAETVSSVAAKTVVLTFFGLGFLALNVGAALWLGDLLGKNYYGFFIASGFYTVVGLVFYFFRNRWIRKPVRDIVINRSLN